MSRPSFASSSLKCFPGISRPADRQPRTRSTASVRDTRPTGIVVFYTLIDFLSIDIGSISSPIGLSPHCAAPFTPQPLASLVHSFTLPTGPLLSQLRHPCRQ
jgi:hypothetical protein